MQLLTIAEASDVLNVPTVQHRALWLRRHLQARERELHVVLLVRQGVGTKNSAYRVDMEAVRMSCPELVSSRDRLAKALHGAATVGRAELVAHRELLEEALDGITVLAAQMRLLAASVQSVEKRLSSMEARRRRGPKENQG